GRDVTEDDLIAETQKKRGWCWMAEDEADAGVNALS
ncbi:MAG: hypothetical protein QOE88_2398, partial [Verrucomicrobiota bacterium]|nr:hypothetical protein [Verrucomicrobiota bacterium]